MHCHCGLKATHYKCRIISRLTGEKDEIRRFKRQCLDNGARASRDMLEHRFGTETDCVDGFYCADHRPGIPADWYSVEFESKKLPA